MSKKILYSLGILFSICVMNFSSASAITPVTKDAEKITVSVDADDGAYIREIYKGVTSHYDELMEEVGKVADKFDVERIYKVDLSILLLAIYEIKYMQDVPFKVSVDEAVNLAHKYSTEKSGKYINGILSKFAR